MRDLEYRKLQGMSARLVSELDLSNTTIIDQLHAVSVLGKEDKDVLNQIPTSHEKNRRLLDILKTKEDTAYKMFRDAVAEHQPHLAEELPLPGVPRSAPTSNRARGGEKGFEDYGVKDLQEWIKPRLQKENIPNTIIDKIEVEVIDGKVFINMTDEDFKEVFTELKFGQRKRLALLRNDIIGGCSPKSVDLKPQKEHARQFGKRPNDTEKYHQNRVFNVHEARLDSSLLSPMRQFFPCSEDSEREDIYVFIAGKVVTFAAACMNDRRNGTIYFGVGNKDCEQYHYGEVLGLPLEKKECEDEIMQWLKKVFSPDTAEAALKCIRVAFMEVVLADQREVHSHFVCEVDIEPQNNIVGERSFWVNVADTASSGKTQGKTRILYRTDNGIPTQQTPDQFEKFTEEKTTLCKERLCEERRQRDQQATYPRDQNLPQLLKDFLCGGTDELGGSFCYLLAVGAVDTSEADKRESFDFVADMDWRGILDFDPKSAEQGLYQHMDEHKEMLYEVKMTEEFSSSESNKQAKAKEHYQDMEESELKPWIFCNGHEKNDEKGHSITQWKKERSTDFRETVAHFVRNFPQKRSVVVILVTSKDDIFIEASEELILRFPDQWVMMAESEHLANQWIDCLQQRDVEVDPKRCLCTFSFNDINKAIHQLMGSSRVSEDACYVKSSSGVDEEISKKAVQALGDLEIVSTKTCDECGVEAVSKMHEENFYKCNPATWCNFHVPGQVFPRDKLEDLKTKTRAVLEGDVEEGDSAGFVAVYHQPGSGGTTIAMNTLWDLHTEFKSCRLKRITADCARQIVTLSEVGESNSANTRRNPKPVLVMIDNADDDQVAELKSRVEKECQNKDVFRLVCVFLICVRCMKLPAKHKAKNIFLQQNVSQREKHYFTEKHRELNKKGRVNMDNLLGLNIMKEDFNKEYIKKTVDGYVKQYSKHEQTLLQHIALLNSYDLSFRAIPVCCFDPLMSHRRGGPPWEAQFDPVPLMLFTTNSRLSGRTKCLRVASHLLCSYILEELETERSQLQANMMEEFLNSTSFPKEPRDFASKDLLNIAQDCMKRRGMDRTGRKSRFSPFIQMLVDNENDDVAVKCIDTVFEITDDAFLAQQVARIYIFRKNLDEAEKWARKAVVRQCNNSFVFDTLGQIYKSRLAELKEKCDKSQERVDAVSAVKIAYEGCKIFQQVQALTEQERNDPPNTSGHFGQIEIILNLFDILLLCPVFPSKADLLQCLSGGVVSPFASQLEPEEATWLLSMEEKAFSCLREVENQKMMCSSSEAEFTSVQAFFLGKDNICHFEEKLNKRFGDGATKGPERLTTGERWRVVISLGGHSLYSVMMKCDHGPEGKENALKIWCLTSLNIKGERITNQLKLRNLSMALASAVTLVSCHDHEFTEEEYRNILKWSLELFQIAKKPDRNQKYINFDPYIYLFVFHWPTPNQKRSSGQCEPKDLKEATGLAKEAFTIYQQERRKKNNPLFFLTKKPSIGKVISKIRLQEVCGKNGARVTSLLQDAKAVKTVEQFTGVLVDHGFAVKLKLETAPGNQTELHIPLYVPERDRSLWNKQVNFVLGVGQGGTVACKPQAITANPNQAAAGAISPPLHDSRTGGYKKGSRRGRQ